MWTCLRCQRMFKNDKQSHYCSDKPQSIEDYILQQEELAQSHLRDIYATLQAALPDATEKISWQMPTFWKRVNLIHFAAFKHHISLFPGAEAVNVFAERLQAHKTSKGTIHFRYDQALPLNLIAEIAHWCEQEVDRTTMK